MSVFTHRPYYAIPNDFGNFRSLARFIDDWDKQFSQQNQPNSRCGQARRSTQQTFSPRFDVRETEQNYQLHGELPGVEKSNVHIEFTDAQTIIIRGNTERTYTEGNVLTGLIDNTSMSGAITDNTHDEGDAVLVDSETYETGSNKSFQATVEDEEAENATATAAVQPTKSKNTDAAPAEKQGADAPQQKAKYWVCERSVGSFSRSFTFSDRVDQEGVSASLNNGILTVIVPKARKLESRRISVN